ncbi:MAG: CBS domain-containing protein, partial [Anaerolineaceae bacterium]
RQGLPVLNAVGELVGMLTLQDIEKAGSREESMENLRAGEICTRPPLTAHPDETIGAALRRMSAQDIGRLPVVSREDPRHLVGLLRRSDVIHAYDLALAKRTALRHRTQEVRLGILSGASVVEVLVEAGSEAAGKRVSELQWSKDCLIASIRRGRTVLLPHGDTMLKSGDILVVVSEGEGLREAQHLCVKKE